MTTLAASLKLIVLLGAGERRPLQVSWSKAWTPLDPANKLPDYLDGETGIRCAFALLSQLHKQSQGDQKLPYLVGTNLPMQHNEDAIRGRKGLESFSQCSASAISDRPLCSVSRE